MNINFNLKYNENINFWILCKNTYVCQQFTLSLTKMMASRIAKDPFQNLHSVEQFHEGSCESIEKYKWCRIAADLASYPILAQSSIFLVLYS